MLGRDTLIGVETAGAALHPPCLAPDASVIPGEQDRLGLEPGHLHPFDVETTKTLSIV
jgi:hypothetical protein